MRAALTAAMCLLVCLILTAPSALARKRNTLPEWEWHLVASLGSGYNDNILGFSNRDRNAFLDKQPTFRTPVETLDDAQSSLLLKPEIRWRAPLKLMVSGEYRFKYVSRAKNPFTNYQSHALAVNVRPRVAGYNWSAGFRALTVPSFYMRVYRDRDFLTYESARYRNWDYEASFKYRFFEPLWLEAKAGYGTYYYNRLFTEFDSKYRELGGGASYALPWDITLSGTYLRRLSDNVGKNQAGVLNNLINPDESGDSEYGDADFHEDEVGGTASAYIPWIRFARTEASVGYRFRRRAYISNQPLYQDPFHRGRLDKRGEFTTGISAQLTRQLGVEGFFAYEERHTDSDEPIVPLLKNFIRREIGLVLTYNIR
jgi:hypothetical protein